MYARLLALTVAGFLTTGCALGTKRTPAPYLPPDLSIPPEALEHCPEAIEPPQSGSSADLLANHVQAMRAYHTCRIHHRALSCAIEGQQGVTINGRPSVPRDACKNSLVKPVDNL